MGPPGRFMKEGRVIELICVDVCQDDPANVLTEANAVVCSPVLWIDLGGVGEVQVLEWRLVFWNHL